jgi:hypothetical protein
MTTAMAVTEAGIDSLANPQGRGVVSPGLGLSASGSPEAFAPGGAGCDDSSAGAGGAALPSAGERLLLSGLFRFCAFRSLRTDLRASSASSNDRRLLQAGRHDDGIVQGHDQAV